MIRTDHDDRLRAVGIIAATVVTVVFWTTVVLLVRSGAVL